MTRAKDRARAAAALLLTSLLAACPASPSSDARDAAPCDAHRERLADGRRDGDAAPSICQTTIVTSVITATLSTVGRTAPVGVLLAGGGVLIAGGVDEQLGAQASAEIFTPPAQILPTGSLHGARALAATAWLADQSLLVVGGFHPVSGSLTGAEVYSPATGTFRQILATMKVGRESHTSTSLPDGKVLIAGGLQSSGYTFHDSLELFVPGPAMGAETFQGGAGKLLSPRAQHVALYLQALDGVLIVGGDSGKGELASAELYQLKSGLTRPLAASLPRPSKALAAAVLPDGRVLLAGGSNTTDGALAQAAMFDPKTESFTALPPMATRRASFTLTTLPDGRVLAAGGWTGSESTRALEVYDPALNLWKLVPAQLAKARHDHVALLLPDCRVLVAGGKQSSGTSSSPRELELVTIPHGR
jgi:hypothetical protein